MSVTANIGTVDISAIKAMLQKHKSEVKSSSNKQNDLNWYRPPNSTDPVTIRILPVAENGKYPGKIVYKHYSLPESGSITCYKTWGEDCPICETLREYSSKITNIDDLRLGSFGRAYLNVLVLSDPTYKSRENKELSPKEPVIMGITEKFLLKFYEDLVSVDFGPGVMDVNTGNNITVRREKEKGGFERVYSIRSSAIADTPDEINEILLKRVDLDSIWRNPDDFYNTKMREANEKLRDMLENRVMGLTSDTKSRVNPAVAHVEKVEPSKVVATAPRQPETTSTTAPAGNPPATVKEDSKKVTPPAGAPACFADASVHSDDRPECGVCKYEYHCISALGKGV